MNENDFNLEQTLSEIAHYSDAITGPLIDTLNKVPQSHRFVVGLFIEKYLEKQRKELLKDEPHVLESMERVGEFIYRTMEQLDNER